MSEALIFKFFGWCILGFVVALVAIDILRDPGKESRRLLELNKLFWTTKKDENVEFKKIKKQIVVFYGLSLIISAFFMLQAFRYGVLILKKILG